MKMIYNNNDYNYKYDYWNYRYGMCWKSTI